MVIKTCVPNFCTFVSFVAALQMIELQTSRINQTDKVIIFLIYMYTKQASKNKRGGKNWSYFVTIFCWAVVAAGEAS